MQATSPFVILVLEPVDGALDAVARDLVLEGWAAGVTRADTPAACAAACRRARSAGQPCALALADAGRAGAQACAEAARLIGDADPDAAILALGEGVPPERGLALPAGTAPDTLLALARMLLQKRRAQEELLAIREGLEHESDQRSASLAEAAASLREKEAFNFALFQHNPMASTIVDREGRVVKSNLARRRAAEKLPELGERLFEGSEGQYEVDMRAALMRAIRTGEAIEIPEQKHGDRYLAITLAPFSSGAIVISDDVTGRKRAEEEAFRQQQQLIQAHKMVALGTLVSGVAHEVSNPNNVMILSAAALRRIVDHLLRVLDRYQETNGDFDVGARPYREIRAEIPDLIDTLGRAAERIKTLVNDLKDFARKDNSDLKQTVDVNKVVRASVTLLSSVMRKSTSRLEERYAEGLPAVDGNAQRIEQVVVNLLTNACQALTSQEQAIRVWTERDPAGRRVLIRVQDEGCGIPEEHLLRITDPFFTTKHDTGGTGLGLSISQNIMETHGGSLSFESKVGRGTTVTLALPCRGGEEV